MPFKPTPRALPNPKVGARKNIWKEKVARFQGGLNE